MFYYRSRAGYLLENHYRLQYESENDGEPTFSSSYQKDSNPSQSGVPFKSEYKEVQKMNQPQLNTQAGQHKDNIHSLLHITTQLTKSSDDTTPSSSFSSRDKTSDSSNSTHQNVRDLQDMEHKAGSSVDNLASIGVRIKT